MAALPPLPEDIMRTEILTRLPVKSVIRFSSVCKSWKSLFSQARFIKDHLKCTIQNPDDDKLVIKKFVNHDSGMRNLDYCEIDILSLSNLSETKLFDILYPKHESHAPVQLVGSINGLVCLYLYKLNHEFRIWNPAIRQAKIIKSPFMFNVPVHLCGFCWDEVEDDFKVVVLNYKGSASQLFGFASLYIYSCNSDSWTWQAEISCNSDSWTWQPADIQFSVNKMPYSGVPSAIVNGVPYWQYCENFGVKTPVIKFDVKSKEFRVVPVLDVAVSGTQHGFLIVNWKEGLSALVSKDYYWYTSVDVYCFDEICGVWSKMHSLGPNVGIVHRLMGCFKYGGQIVFETSENYMCFDHKTNKIKSLAIRKGKLLTCYSYKPSLLSLQGMKKLYIEHQ